MKSVEDIDGVVSESLSLSSVRQESGLVAGDQSAACLAQVIFGHVGEEVYTEKRIYVSEILTLKIALQCPRKQVWPGLLRVKVRSNARK